MTAEALERPREPGQIPFHSRPPHQRWHKGETSGNTQAVKAIRYDCDADALLALVEPTGPACHTGERSCFHRGDLTPAAPHETLPTLERTIADRARTRPETSYTAKLLDDPKLAGAKVQEVAEEAADVIYHLAVLLRGRGLSLADAEQVLDGRRNR